MTDQIENEYQDSLKGQFLMAMPELLDPNFSMTVTCICEHSASGSIGLVINRIHSMVQAKDIFTELHLDYSADMDSIPIFIGGPVHVNEIFILHGPPFNWEGCYLINSSLAMSNTIDILQSIALGKGPDDYLISLGCAGWGPGQLESEIRQNSWITCPAFEEIIFNVPVELKWKEALSKVGIDPVVLSNKSGNA